MNLLPVDDIRARAVTWQKQPGIYFLIASNEIVYVGKSKNIYPRVLGGEHRSGYKIEFDSWAWVPCDLASLDDLERLYIDAFDPPRNKDHTTLTRRGVKRTRRPDPIGRRRVITPAQVFDSTRHAAAVHGISVPAVYERIARRRQGWKYAPKPKWEWPKFLKP